MAMCRRLCSRYAVARPWHRRVFILHHQGIDHGVLIGAGFPAKLRCAAALKVSIRVIGEIHAGLAQRPDSGGNGWFDLAHRAYRPSLA